MFEMIQAYLRLIFQGFVLINSDNVFLREMNEFLAKSLSLLLVIFFNTFSHKINELFPQLYDRELSQNI